MRMTLNVLSMFKFNFDCIEALFYKSKINSHGVYFTKKKKRRNILYISKNMICTTANSHVNSSKSNNLNTSKSDNVIGNSNLPSINIQTKVNLMH